jgi:beta-galactosidase GanA
MIRGSSRREFLATLAGGAAVAWSGLRIAALPDAVVAGLTTGHEQSGGGSFIYGTHFYRPPDPPASQRHAMLTSIAETYKFNTVRIFTSWAYCNPEPDRFDFADVEELMGYCDELGLKVLMGVMLEDAPYWLESAHPESRFVNADDRAYHLGGAGNNVSAGAPGLCLDWQSVREAAAKYIRAMTKVVSAHPSLYAYDCWNEPCIVPTGFHFSGAEFNIKESSYCYCRSTIDAFRSWLQRRYGTLSELCEVWARKYPSWSMIDPPRELGTYPDWVDWRRFMIDRSTEEMRFRVEQVRAEDLHCLLESHFGVQVAVDASVATLGINPWRMAEMLGTVGLSYVYVRTEAQGPIHRGAARLELTRCQAGDKPFWLTELAGGTAGGSLFHGRKMRVQDIRLWNWLAVATGAKGVLYWTYTPASKTAEAGGFALVAADGSPTERVLEAADDHRLVQAHWDVIEHYMPRTDVAILFDQDSDLMTFAVSGNSDVAANSFRGYYKALWCCDLWADFIEPRNLGRREYKVIVVPWHLILKKEVSEQLRRYVESGGTLVIESGFGMFSENASYNPVIPPFGLDDAFGYREGESYSLPESSAPVREDTIADSDRVYTNSHMAFTVPIEVTIKPRILLTPVTAKSGASVIAKYESTPVATRKTLGHGQVFYIGTNLGASVEAGDPGGIELMRSILIPVVQPEVTAEKVRPRLIVGTDRSLLVIVNENPRSEHASIKLPGRYRRGLDLYTGREYSLEANSIEVVVPDESVSVLRLE